MKEYKRFLYSFRAEALLIIFVTILLAYFGLSSNTPLGTLYKIGPIIMLIIEIVWIKKAKKRVRKLFYSDVTLSIFEQYLAIYYKKRASKPHALKRFRFNYLGTVVNYDLLLGNNDGAQASLEQLQKLNIRNKKHREIIAINQVVVNIRQSAYASREALEEAISSIPFTSEKHRQSYSASLLAQYDLLIVQIPNDHYDQVSDTAKGVYAVHIAQHNYYRALNARLKGDNDRADALFSQLASLDSPLYVVKEARMYVEEKGEKRHA